jgi:hypothetical protein
VRSPGCRSAASGNASPKCPDSGRPTSRLPRTLRRQLYPNSSGRFWDALLEAIACYERSAVNLLKNMFRTSEQYQQKRGAIQNQNNGIKAGLSIWTRCRDSNSASARSIRSATRPHNPQAVRSTICVHLCSSAVPFLSSPPTHSRPGPTSVGAPTTPAETATPPPRRESRPQAHRGPGDRRPPPNRPQR